MSQHADDRVLTLRLPGPDKERALSDVLGRLVPRTLFDPGDVPSAPRTHTTDETDAHVTAVHHLPAQAPVYAPFPPGIDPRLVQVYAARGVEQLYSHQAEAAAHALASRHVVVVTPTASGKTLCYNLPVLNTVIDDPSARALYLFPTKALAQDQLAELHALAGALEERGSLPVGVFTYDGDTPQDARRAIRQQAHVVLSNPDMLHAGVLPHHPRWAKLFENLRYVVIDELHAYRGVFGSHLANILRRLQRVCRHYGSSPVFICSSATIANPRALAERLTGERFELVDRNGAPRGEKFFLFVNPPVVNPQLGIRRSYLGETRRVAREFIARGLQAIVFAQSRLATEILTTYLKDDFAGAPGSADAIRGYRGGYLPLRRREIERGLREGSVRAVVSTNALELGIDIGALDVAVLAGYPGTIAATWQRAGRAGRRSGRSVAVLVASSAPLDQYVVRHPEYFFEASPEHALINPDNLELLFSHLKCATFELPFSDDERFGGLEVKDYLGLMSEEGLLHHAGDQWNWTSESYPANAVSLRSISSDNFVVIDQTEAPRIIAETDYTSAFSMLHEKAIYIVEGQLYQVERLDVEGRKAYVREVDCDYYTDAIQHSRVTVLDEFARSGDGEAWAAWSGTPLPVVEDADGVRRTPQGPEGRRELPAPLGDRAIRSHGEVLAVARVVGFKKIKFYTNENVGSGELDLPERPMHTTSYWLTIPRALLDAMPFSSDDKRDGVSGLAHAMRSIAQLLLMCDQQDLGLSVDTGDEPETSVPVRRGMRRTGAPLSADARIFLYDNYPGGIGLSGPLFEMHGALLARTRQLIEECPCEVGCPSCVGPIGDVGPHAKAVASALLTRLLDRPPAAAESGTP